MSITRYPIGRRFALVLPQSSIRLSHRRKDQSLAVGSKSFTINHRPRLIRKVIPVTYFLSVSLTCGSRSFCTIAYDCRHSTRSCTLHISAASFLFYAFLRIGFPSITDQCIFYSIPKDLFQGSAYNMAAYKRVISVTYCTEITGPFSWR